MDVLVTGADGMMGRAVVSSMPSAAMSLRTHVGRHGRTATDAASADRSLADAARSGASVACDITDIDGLRPVAEGADVVIHLAGPPSVADSFAAPAEFLRVHAVGTHTIVRLCHEMRIPRLVYVSSADVYGRPAHNPVAEQAAPAPRSPYAAAKLAAEAVVGAATRSSDLAAVVLRPFSIYGPASRAGSVVGLIGNQVLDGDAVRLRSFASVRDYCYVDDVADAIWRAATGPTGELSTFNISTGVGTAIDDLAWLALEAHGVEPGRGSVEAVGGPGSDRPTAADIPELVADVDRARDELGWAATTSLRTGLARTLAGFAAARPER